MEKVLYTNLFSENVELPEDKTLVFKGEVIYVKQYIPLEQKMEIIQNVVNICAFDKVFLNAPQAKVVQEIEMIKFYTNIEFPDSSLSDVYSLYDNLVLSGLIDALFLDALIPLTEQNFIIDNIYNILIETFKYNNSAQGIIRNIIASANENMLNINDLVEKVKDPAIGEFLKNLKDSQLV